MVAIKLFASVFLAISLANADGIPTRQEAALNARQLVHTNKFATLSTVFPTESDRRTPAGLEGAPIGLIDYYADCDEDGQPTLLFMPVGTNFYNARKGSKISFSVFDPEDLKKPVPADHPRLALVGELVEIDAPPNSEEDLRLRECFRAYHADAWWTPEKRVHGGGNKWAKIEVQSAYFVGGFGNHAYIGQLDVEEYKSFSKPQIFANMKAGSFHKSSEEVEEAEEVEEVEEEAPKDPHHPHGFLKNDPHHVNLKDFHGSSDPHHGKVKGFHSDPHHGEVQGFHADPHHGKFKGFHSNPHHKTSDPHHPKDFHHLGNVKDVHSKQASWTAWLWRFPQKVFGGSDPHHAK